MVHACPVSPTGCAFLVCFQLTSSEDENVPESFSLTFGDSSGNSGVNLLFCKNKLLFRESGRYFHGRGIQLQYQKCYCRTVLHLYSGASLRSVAAKIDNYLTTDKLIPIRPDNYLMAVSCKARAVSCKMRGGERG